MKTHLIVVIVCCALLETTVLTSAADRSFTVIPLPRWQELEFHPHAMNDRGQIVGLTFAPTEQCHLLLWEQDKGFVELGHPSAYCGKCDINNHGQICGEMAIGPNGRPQAFLRDPDGTVVLLGHLGGHSSFARAINNQGQIVGASFTGMMYRAFVWDRDNGMRELWAPARHPSEAVAISNSGQILGLIDYWHGVEKSRVPYYWEPEETANYSCLRAPDSNFSSMNDRGWVVGRYFFKKDGPHVALWQGKAGIRKLFANESDAGAFRRATWKVNDADQIVCIAEDWIDLSVAVDEKSKSLKNNRFFWDPVRGKIPLDPYLPPKTTQFTVLDLNNRGCVLGIAHREDGEDTALILEPIFTKN